MNDGDYPVPVGFALDQVGDNSPAPEWLWREIAIYFYANHDLGMVLDACAGDGRLYKLLLNPKAWCEAQLDRNYFDYEGSPDTIMTNSSWDPRRFTDLLAKMLEDARHHLILFGPLRTVWGTRARATMIERAGFATRTLIRLPPYSISPKDPRRKGIDTYTMCGPQIVIAHWQRGYKGDVKELNWNHLTEPSIG